MGCGRGGTGGDSDLNKQKNRIDGVPNGNDPMWHNVSLQSLLDLSWPSSIEGSTPLDTKPRGVWTSVEKSYIAQYEGVPVQVEGWLLGAKQEGQESTNCNATPSTQPERVDYHLWIVDAPGKIKQQSMVIEITPRLRINHSSGGWDIAKICGIINRAATPTPSPSHPYVRISGWLMMDEAHRDQLGQHRASLWEIHPILAFDVWNGTTWVPLDSVP